MGCHNGKRNMPIPLKQIKNRQIQSLLLMGMLVFFVAHFLLLSPSGLEEDFNGVRVIHPKDLLSFIQKEASTLPDIPKLAPDYTLRELTAYSSTESKPNWKLSAKKSSAYSGQQIIHGKEIQIDLPDGTWISASEGIFFLKTNEGKFYGNVIAQFNNGVTITTDYAEVSTLPVTRINIPAPHPVHGEKRQPRNSVFFDSTGLSYSDTEPKVLYLLSRVRVELSAERRTRIESDMAVYRSLDNMLSFSMDEKRPLSEQMVRATQTDLELQSRALEVKMDPTRQLQRITASQEVSIRDFHDPKHISTATSGKAIYDVPRNEFILKDFPQLYQDGDTVTGDTITYNRNTDTIEVKESNAIYKH